MSNTSRAFNPIPFTWDNGELFNGYLLALLAPSWSNTTAYSQVVLNDNMQKLVVPLANKLPIRNGYLQSDAAVFKTTSLTPPRSKYSYFYYDTTDRLIFVEGNLNGAYDDTLEITGRSFPNTDFPPAFPFPENVPNNIPQIEDLAGVKDSSNTIFTVSRVGTRLDIIMNDLGTLVLGVNYTVGGVGNLTITLIGIHPAPTDVLKAFIW